MLMGQCAVKTRSWMPASLELRGLILVLLVVISIGLPGFLAYRTVAADQQRRAGSNAEALLAVALRAYLESAARASPDYDQWIVRLAEQEQRVCWAGIFTNEQEGLEFRRRTNLRREEIVAQIPFDAPEPKLSPLSIGRAASRRFMLLTVPQPESGVVLAAVVDLGRNSLSNTPLIIAGLVGAALAGLALALAWFHLAIQRPIQSLNRWVTTVQQGLSQAALDHGLPDEFQGLVSSVKATQRELQKWQIEANQLRYSLDVQLDAKTKGMTRQLSRAEREADTDPLTKLYNRRALERELPLLFDDSQQNTSRELTAVWFDVDHFKQLNDTLGHQAGDELLTFIGQLLTTTIRKSTDLAVRYGGDEFVLILPDTSATTAIAISERIRRLFLQRSRLLDTVSPRPTISAGVASMREHGIQSWQALLERADEAMYVAKQNSRGVATVPHKT